MAGGEGSIDGEAARQGHGLVERAAEIALFTRLLAHGRRGAGSVVVLNGAVATGKTELLNALVEDAAATGAVVLTALGSPAERDEPLALVSQLFRTPPPFSPDDDVAWHLAADAADAATAADHLSTSAVHDLWSALDTLARRVPVVIGVDDLQFADVASLRCLAYFGGRLRASRVLMIITENTGHVGTDAQRAAWHTDLLRQPHCHRMQVSPLSPRGVAELLGDRLRRPVGAVPITRWHHVSGGNPLLLRALIEDHADAAGQPTAPVEPAPAEAAAPVAGTAFGQAYLTCLQRGGPDLLQVARGLAILAESDSYASLHQLVDADGPTVEQALDLLNRTGLLGAGRFRHPAARAAVIAEMSPDERSHLHQQAARLLHVDGAAPRTVAAHLVAAHRPPGPWAFAVLCRAVQETLDDDRHFATACLRLAHLACDDDVQRATVALLRLRIGSPGAEVDTLTAAEHKVAVQAALGGTNREIARILHITVSTVEQHLTRVYRKLGVKGRADLRATFTQFTREDLV